MATSLGSWKAGELARCAISNTRLETADRNWKPPSLTSLPVPLAGISNTVLPHPVRIRFTLIDHAAHEMSINEPQVRYLVA